MRGRFLNRALVLLLISSMAAGTVPQAYAVEGYNDVTADVDEITGDLIVGSGGVGITDVTLLVEGEDEPEPEVVPFSAYVPVELPIKMNTQGDVFTPDNAMIINGVETKGIKVESITASLDDGWAPADWDDDFSAKEKDTQEISLKLRGDTLDSSGNFNITEGDWNIPKNSYIDLNMGAKLPKQSANSNKKRVAQLEFALNWSGDNETEGPQIPIDIGKPETPDPDPTPVESDIKAIYNDSILLPGSTNTIKFDWTADAEDITLDSVESSDTSVVEVVQEQTRIASLSEGSKVVTIRAIAKGQANVTAKLSTGKEAVVSIDVCEFDESGEITFDIDESKLVAGGSLTADDITANIPVVKPDGSTTTIQRHPSSLDNNTLVEGSNTISGKVDINGAELPIEVTTEATPAPKVIDTITTSGVTTSYKAGESFDGKGNVVINYTDGTSTTIPITQDMLSGFDTSSTGNKEVTITYEGKTTTITVNVVPATANLQVIYDDTEKLFAGDTTQVIFTWDDIEGVDLSSVTSSVPALISVGNIAKDGNSAVVTLQTKVRGTAKITGTLNNGDKAEVTVGVYGQDTTKDITTVVNADKIKDGQVLTPDDITVTVPIRTPNGGFENITVKPSTVPSTPLKTGDNTIVVQVPLGNQTINVNITINVVYQNPSDSLVLSVAQAKELGFTFASYQDGLEITGFENVNFSNTVNVPKQIGDFEVLRIGNGVFKDQSNLKTITLPNTVKSIGTQSFMGCTNLNALDLPDSVSSIPDEALFKTGIKEFKVGSNIQTIGIRGLAGNTQLTSLVFEDGDKALALKDYALATATALPEVNLPDRVNSLGKDVFSGTPNLKLYIKAESINTAGTSFAATGLKEVVIRGETLHPSAFRNCEGLDVITLEEGIKQIGVGAFNTCKASVVNIPQSAQTFVYKLGYGTGDPVFSDAARTINYNGDRLSFEKLLYGEDYRNMEVSFPARGLQQSKIVYKKGNNGINPPTESQVSSDYTITYTNSGMRLHRLKSTASSITVPMRVGNLVVQYIGNAPNSSETRAGFAYDNTTLRSITLPESVIWIGSSSFNGCSNLSTLNLPKHLLKIDDYGIFLTPKITTLKIPQSSHVWGKNNFSTGGGSEGLRTIYYEGSESQWQTQMRNNNLPSTVTVKYNQKIS